MFRAIIAMMDVPTALELLSRSMHRRPIGRGGALLIIICGVLILGPLCYIFWRFDLDSTWKFFDWLIAGGAAPVQDAAAKLTIGPDATAAQLPQDDQTGRLMLMLFGSGFMLLPTAVQLGLSRFVDVPGLGALVKLTIALDLVTDWPTMWKLAEGATWYEQFGWLAWPARIVGAAVGAVAVSLIVQSVIILLIALLFTMAVRLVWEPRPATVLN